MLDEKLKVIIDEYWKDFQNKKDFDYVVKPSIPIIWFGNLEEYKKNNNKKIITVSINPSKKEFEDDNNNSSFGRFENMRNLKDKKSLNDEEKSTLYSSLNSYFINKPYSSWFNYYNKVLNNFKADYNPNGGNKYTAIHVDLYTAIATKPWKTLTKEEKDKISNKELFFNFLNDYLKPDVILFSARKDELKKVFKLKKENIICCIKKSRGFNIELYKYNNAFIIYGRNNYGMPFNLGDDFIEKSIPKIKSKIEI